MAVCRAESATGTAPTAADSRALMTCSDFPRKASGEEKSMAKPKVLILTGDAAESLEVMYPYQRLLEEGYEVQIAATVKKKLRFVVHDFEPGFDTYTEKPGYSWDADLAFKDVNPADYVALVIPGGRAPEHIRNHEDFRKIVRHFFEQKKPVAQRCHAPLALIAAGVLKS